MNKEPLIKVAEWLENGAPLVGQERAGFSMHTFFDNLYGNEPVFENSWVPENCGTVMCIGGAVCDFYSEDNHYSQGEAERILDVNTEAEEHNVEKLFYPWDNIPEEYNDIRNDDEMYSPKRCAMVLRYFIAYNVVDWGIAARDYIAEKDAA